MAIPLLGRLIGGFRGVVDDLRDADPNAVGRLREQVPYESPILPRYRRRDVRRRVPQTDGEDLGRGGRGQETRTEGQDSFAIGRRAFWKDDENSLGVLCHQRPQVRHLGALGGVFLGSRERAHDRAEERDVLHLARVRVGDGEDRVEDSSEVQRVDGRGKRGCDDIGGLRHAPLVLLRQRALLDAVDLQVDPPDARDAQNHPQDGLFIQRAQREPLQHQEVGGRNGDEEGQFEEEQHDVGGEVDAGGRRGDGEEGRDARSSITELRVFLHRGVALAVECRCGGESTRGLRDDAGGRVMGAWRGR